MTSQTMTPLAKSREMICILLDHSLKPRSYSGRGMYGASCVGVSLSDEGEAFDLAPDMERAFGKVLRPTFDSLGRGVICYWPALPWPEGARDEGDDE